MSGAAARAYEIVKAEIINGRLAGKTRLKEAELAELTGVSRTPVREALRWLEADGLVVMNPNSGAHVAVWSAEDLREITDLRALLESFGASLAAKKITAEQIAELESLQARMEAAIAQANAESLGLLAGLNKEFHLAIIGATGNHRLVSTLQSIVEGPLIFRKFAVFSPEQIERSFSHHRDLIAALKAGDSDWAESTMRSHIFAARSADAKLEQAAEAAKQ
ncbi:MAG: GntR family transcriptional regulator [Alphaproteobacteria bacterium]|jgi:DNA-binding GntR family transcriptional regulator|nr:GntR family transcriptional regulator [Alphaproteobacteria bacterium]MBT4082580.1 GntR family transcriptional regulator [Alphaproteobacteria bacterium]MBT4545842.1 GntR family transcriptional regulator [Alphaproteobacteria bacterium]MBT7747850.1 GntR family transcriptional regulator [Alphaproteobacteria bacterium]